MINSLPQTTCINNAILWTLWKYALPRLSTSKQKIVRAACLGQKKHRGEAGLILASHGMTPEARTAIFARAGISLSEVDKIYTLPGMARAAQELFDMGAHSSLSLLGLTQN